jgi:hypothetical protein
MLAVVALAACGRISFDPLGGDAGAVDGSVDGSADAAPDAPPLPCSATNFACGSGTVRTCGATCFVTCDTTLTWAEAQDLCLAWGGNLARTDTAADLTCLANDINDAWIGLVQDAAATTAAGWRWTHGGPFGFTAWSAGEPDDSNGIEDGEEQCGLFSAGAWIDDGCTAMKNVACSRPAP